MCGITGAIIKADDNKYLELLKTSEIRGQDGTGISIFRNGKIITWRSELKASDALKDLPDEFKPRKGDVIVGQNRLAIFGLDHSNDQPLTTDRYALVHNGNLFKFEEEFEKRGLKREYKVDTELILRVIEKSSPEDSIALYYAIKDIADTLLGDLACLVLDATTGALGAFKKYKPLCMAEDDTGIYFFSTPRIGLKLFSKVEELENFSAKVFLLENEIKK